MIGKLVINHKIHEPVLLKEVIEALHIKNQGKYIDTTLGAGGISMAILENGGTILGIDTDKSMIEIAKENLKGKKAKLVNANFRNLKKIAQNYDFNKVDGIVFDLGVSNVHFSDKIRGFSFQNPDAKLDMRLDMKTQSVKASDLLNVLRVDQLSKILGKSLAKKVIEFRKTKKFEKVKDLLSLFEESSFRKAKHIHPATVAFLQLRIAVNSELENLREALPQSWDLLKPGGSLVVVSFHSLEDEIVKNFMKSKGEKNEFVRPNDEEIKKNPKSRSAKMRVLIK